MQIRPVAAADALAKKPTPESGTYTWSSGPVHLDALGNIVAIGGDTYGYDANNRLAGATIKGPDGTQTFNRTFTGSSMTRCHQKVLPRYEPVSSHLVC